jgi:hypothetical protein
MVSPAEWGPKAWDLLHGISEKIGNQQHEAMIRDERNELLFTLKYFGSLLPCKKCQEHYRQWLLKAPPDKLVHSGFLDTNLKKWVYDLHVSVNQSRGIETTFLESNLHTVYSHINLRESAQHLKQYYNQGLQTGIFKADEWKRAWKHLDLLLRLL